MNTRIIITVFLMITSSAVFTIAQERGASGAEDAELGDEVEELKRDTEYLKNENERLKEELADESDDLDKRIEDTFKYYALYSGGVALYVSLVLFLLGYFTRSEILKRVEELKREYFKRVDVINEIERGLRKTTNDARETIEKARKDVAEEFQQYETKLLELKENTDLRFEKLTRRYEEVQKQIVEKTSKELPPLSEAASKRKEVDEILNENPMFRESSEFLYEAAIAGDIIDKVILENLANNLFYGEDYGKAIDIWELLKPSDPAEAGWDYNIGVALDNLEKHEEAVAAYERAIELNPNDVYSYNNKGVNLVTLERYEEAFVAYKQAKNLKPDFAEVLANEANLFIKLNKYDDAVRACDKALEINERLALAYYNRACANSLLGNREAMEADLRKATEFDDKHCRDAKEDPDFDPFREEVDALLNEICPDN